MARKVNSANKHNLNIDEICNLIVEGLSYRKIAEKLKCPLSTFHDFICKSVHSARAREALEYSAQTFDDQAEKVLIEAKSTMTEIQRAKELAQHYRWKASKRNPKRFSDKVQNEVTGSLELKQITGQIIK
jgi:hypothetical protein